jgi:uncharacterized membrane protein YecN with MAPEG domain
MVFGRAFAYERCARSTRHDVVAAQAPFARSLSYRHARGKFVQRAAPKPTDRRDRPRVRPSRPPFGFSLAQWPFIKVLVASWIFSLSIYLIARFGFDWEPASWDFEDRVKLVFTSGMFASAPVVLAIIIVAAQRLNQRLMVGHIVRPNSPLDINMRFIQNTFEQLILYFIAHLGVIQFAYPQEARLLIALTALFLIGRVIFWYGYHHNPRLRAFGFGVTFYPTVAIYLWLFLRTIFGVHI